jgi:DNA-binding MarR family transcriptional regulator
VIGDSGREAWRLLIELSAGEGKNLIDATTQTGLTPGLYRALRYLPQGDGVSMRQLADTWGCDASYVTSVVDGLEERGLARRNMHPTDRRIKNVAATKKGVQVRDRVTALLEAPPRAMDVLTDAEQSRLLTLLRKVDLATRDGGSVKGKAIRSA